jgi:hypothetical protein
MDDNISKIFLETKLEKSKVIKKFLILINDLYKNQLISVLEQESIFKNRKIYTNFLNYKILKQIKNELKNKILICFEKIKLRYDSAKKTSYSIIDRINTIGDFLKKEDILNFIKNFSSETAIQKETYIINYATNKIKTSLSIYVEAFRYNKTIEIRRQKANNCLEMIKTFFKYFFKKVNQKIVSNNALKKIINKNDENILDNILLITPDIEVDIVGLNLKNKECHSTSLDLYQKVISVYSQNKVIICDKEILMDKFIHFLDRKGIFL